jgi:hypothetical protein
MKYFKKPKYKLDAKKIPIKQEKDLEGEELFREMLKGKRRKAR